MSIPADAPRSPDGHYYWDGQAWLPIPQPPTPPAAPPSAPGTDQYGSFANQAPQAQSPYGQSTYPQPGQPMVGSTPPGYGSARSS